jgi:hypothetical protein
MDCKTARNLLEFNRPPGRDLDAPDRAALAAHLAVCPDCDGTARAERQFDEHLGRAVRDVPIPHGLKERLLGRLRRQRDEWWLEGAKRVARYAAVAAALALIVWGGLAWKDHQKPALTSAELAEDFLGQYVWSPPKPRDAEELFARKGQRVPLPPEFDYGYLAAFGMAEFRDREVPHLRFARSTSQGLIAQSADVYILTRKLFDLSRVEDFKGPEGYRVKVEIRKPTQDYVYVTVYTGDLQDLRQQADPPAE